MRRHHDATASSRIWSIGLTASRPNQLWVSDFTSVPTVEAFVYTACVIEFFSRRIVGWKVATTTRTAFVLDALEQAIQQRGAEDCADPVSHSDRGVQLVDAVHPSVGRRRHRAVRGQSLIGCTRRR